MSRTIHRSERKAPMLCDSCRGLELIVPGKRWEATREGVEDYAYLYLLKQAIAQASPEGAANAKALLASSVEKVVKNVNNPLLADKVKRQILETILELSPTQ